MVGTGECFSSLEMIKPCVTEVLLQEVRAGASRYGVVCWAEAVAEMLCLLQAALGHVYDH